MNNLMPSRHWQRHAGFFVLSVLTAYAWWQAVALVGASSLTVDDFALFAFVPPVCISLIWMEWRQVGSNLAYWPSIVPAYAVLVAAGFALSHSSNTSLSIFLFVAACIAAFSACYGRAAGRKALFPLLLLFAAVPLPPSWLARAIWFLQQGSATATEWLFSLAHIPFVRQGLVFSLPTLDIEIARECSGIRSSLVLLVCGLVVAHLFLKSFWTQAVLAVAVVPITIAKNGLRIFTLSTLGMYVDASFLTGRLHRNGGIFFFALSFAALLGLIWLLRKTEHRKTLRIIPTPASVAAHSGF
jgi:exosortase